MSSGNEVPDREFAEECNCIEMIACPNDCILYRNATCGVSRYKANNDEFSHNATANNSRPTKVYWYLPIIPRFK